MSVTIRLSDEDAKIVGMVLGEVGEAVKAARRSDILSAATLSASGSLRNTLEREDQAKAVGRRLVTFFARSTVHSQTPEELVRIGHAFDTVVYANEKGN